MKRNRRRRLSDEGLCDAVHEAICRLGWAVPTDEAAVAAAEEWQATADAALPDAARVPDFAAPDPQPVRAIRLWESSPMDVPLARAAREGGHLSPEVEEAMRRDREAAEAELTSRRQGTAKDGE